MRRSYVYLALAALVALAACSGGASHVTPAPGTTGGVPLTISVKLPAAGTSAAARLPAYVSSGTFAIAVFAAPNGQPLPSSTHGLTAPCSASACTITINVPAGVEHIAVGLIDANRNYLAVGDHLVSVIPGAANSVAFVFFGIPASVSFALLSGTTTFTPGLAASATLSVSFLDDSGAVISGSAPLFYTYSLTSNVGSAVTFTPSILDAGVIAPNSAGTSTNIVTVHYDGTIIKVPSLTLSAVSLDGQSQLAVSAPAFTFSGTAPVFSTIAQTGVNVATQQNGSTWLGYVPAAVTLSSGVAVSVQFPSSITTPAPGLTPNPGGSFAFQLGNGDAPFTTSRRIAATSPAVPPHLAYDLPNVPVLARTGLAAYSMHRSTFSARRARAQATVGATRNFWVDQASIASGTVSPVSIPFVLQAVTAHGQIWVDATRGTPTSTLSAGIINQIAGNFEAAYALVSRYYGSSAYAGNVQAGSFDAIACLPGGSTPTETYDTFPIPDPGYMSVLITDQSDLGQGFGGYNSPGDYFPQDLANCYGAESNETPTITIGWFNGGLAEAQGFDLEAIAHEYTEIVAWVQHAILRGGQEEPNSVLDGLAQIAQDLSRGGLSPDTVYSASVYLSRPENYALTSFSGLENGQYGVNCSGCYGETYLFFRYLVDRFGTGILATIAQTAQTGMANISVATGESPQQLIEDFATTLAVSGTGISNVAAYNYTTFPLRRAYADIDGNRYSAAQLTPQPALTVNAGLQTVGVYPGAFVFFALPSSGNAVKVTDVQQDRSLWLGLATK